MTPEEFIAKWRGVELPEVAASHDHFNELCELLDLGKPTDEDPRGEWFTFEKAVPKAGKGGGSGFADVWRKGCFVWEYKRKKTYNTLAAAIAQARDYAAQLENPPLAIACDIDEIQIRTLFTGSVSVTHTIRLGDLNDAGQRQLLRRCFTDPASLRPDLTPQHVTEEAARKFATLAQGLRERRDRLGRPHDPGRVAHFLNKIVFCLFAEDSGLLPGNVFSAIVEEALRDKSNLSPLLADLFDKMRTGMGYFGTVRIPHFNGGLFNDDDVLELLFPEVQTLGEAMRLDWASIEPVIFGTLFERGLDPARRKEMAGLFDAEPKPGKGRRKKAAAAAPPALPLKGGATAAQRSLGKGVGIHYTDTDTIMKIVEPVVLRPLAAEWETVKAAIGKAKGTKKKDDLYLAFRERLGAFRVLDPACGSGNFLYLALRHLKDFDKKVEEEGKALGVTADPKGQRITPRTVLGIEINPYAAELARVTVWISELQWQMANGYGVTRKPILEKLDGIRNEDALVDESGAETEWPKANAIIGNPPFLGNKLWIRRLGEEYSNKVRSAYAGRLPGTADLVAYWVEKSRLALKVGRAEAFGLVTTKSIAKGSSRSVMDRVVGDATLLLFDAWTNEPWALDGAAVRVSLVCAKRRNVSSLQAITLNGMTTKSIYADLTAGERGFDLTKSKRLIENRDKSFQGVKIVGQFDLAGPIARDLLRLPVNPNGRLNSEVLRLYIDVDDVVDRPSDRWVVDFGVDMSIEEASQFEAPFAYLEKSVKPTRALVRRKNHREFWWLYGESRPGLRTAIEGLTRYIVVPETSKHLLFRWADCKALVAGSLFAIAFDDDGRFGVLQSNIHRLWSVASGNRLGVGNDPRYNATVTFRTFPFPEDLGSRLSTADLTKSVEAKRVATMSANLNELRENWLNPSDLVKREPEVVPGYPDRVLPKNAAAAEQLKKRTLTNLYNERPTWLMHAHRDLDRAVAAAYGWPEELADRAQPENPDAADRKAAEEEILKRLFDLNQERVKAGR